MLAKSFIELNTIREECYSLVNTRAGLSAGAAVVPVPGADIGADVALLMEMLPKINHRFGLTPEQISHLDDGTRQYILLMIKNIGAEFVGKMVTKQAITTILKKAGISITTKSVAKYVPFIGSAVSASVSFGLMRSVGRDHVDECYRVAYAAMKNAKERAANEASSQAI